MTERKRPSKEDIELALRADLPASYDETDVAAIQALLRGDASAYQQKRGLDWIINHASNYYDLSYRGDKTHDSAFLEGRRFVGAQIIKLTKLTPTQEPTEHGGHSSSQG